MVGKFWVGQTTNVTQPPQPPDDAWPTAEAPTVLLQEETVVGAPLPPDPRPDRQIGKGMLLALGVLALIVIGILVAYLLTHRQKDPPVTTTVVTTSPPASSPAATPKVTVPRLIGMQERSALARLDQLGLKASETLQQTSGAAGIVVAQAPLDATEVAKGSQVTVVVTRTRAPTTTSGTTTTGTTTDSTTTTPTTTAAPPPQNATMPNVTGGNEAAAVQAMGKVGVLASLFFVPGQDPLGTVVQQAKAADTTVPVHSHVQINLSKGPNNTTNAQVPNVIGQTLTQAVGALNDAHLRLIYLKLPVTERAQAGKVVQQSPLGGGQAPQNAQVVVYLGAYHLR